jgi:beta-glucosidase/6-phospho-beta-glucosidase/beta-galactosidase
VRSVQPFMFATGIENSYPTIARPDGSRARVDEMEKCGHYGRWREDFTVTKELGIDYLRFGPPYYSTHTGPGQYDWEFSDHAFAALNELGITPIVDMCHFGVPDWIGDFQNPDWPPLFAEYARAFAARFPHLRFYTPINEIFIVALFSAAYGWWNERLSSDRAFVTALKHLCQANMMAMRAIIELRPDAVFVQSESSEYFHAESPRALARAEFLNERRLLALDLTYGVPVSALMYQYLLDSGMTRDEYEWFGRNQVKANCVMGNDYYITNEHLVDEDGATHRAGEVFGYYVITWQYFKRYHLPVMHTETNIHDVDAAPEYLRKQWANIVRLRQDGVDIIGFTWYSLTDQIDWDTALREENGRVNPCGLVDLGRKIRPVGRAYAQLIRDWRSHMILGSRVAF